MSFRSIMFHVKHIKKKKKKRFLDGNRKEYTNGKRKDMAI